MQSFAKHRLAIIVTMPVIVFVMALPAAVKAEQRSAVYPVAILPFSERGREVEELGQKTSDLLFAGLIANPNLYLVDRAGLEKLLDEQILNLTGVVNPSQATQVGQLTGAKILITGSVLQVDSQLYLIAKIIGTETSRVLGASVKGNVRDDLGELVEKLAEQVVTTIQKRADELVAKPKKQENRLAALKKVLGRAALPKVKVDVRERHVGQATVDPTAATEIMLICTELGFKVIDPDEEGQRDADILLTGEGFSEFATRHGELVSVKARLEVKAIDVATGQVVAIDRQVSVAVDLTEQIAGKAALQEAAAEIAERLLPKIVRPNSDVKRKASSPKSVSESW